jgi:hypothetical protein
MVLGSKVACGRLHVARRLCWAIAVAVALGGGFLAADAYWHLNSALRGWALAVWWTTLLVLVGRSAQAGWLLTPTTQQHGSGVNLAAVALAALSLGTVVMVLLSWSEAPQYLRRLFVPWWDRGPWQYRITVTSGDAALPTGQRFSVCGYIEPLVESVPWPPTACLIRQAVAGRTSERIPVQIEDNGAFHVVIQATEDFRYRIQAGNALSDWYRIVTIDPVRLLPESVVIVEPPPYARQRPGQRYALPETDSHGVRVVVYQHGALEVRAYFSHPVAVAYLEWKGGEERPVEVMPLLLDAAQRSGRVRWNIAAEGRFRLVAVQERQGQRWSSQWQGLVELVSDRPPRWLEVAGLMTPPRRLKRGTVLPIHFRVQDDFGIEEVVLDYSSERQPWPESLIIPLRRCADGTVEGQYDFPIDDRFHDGDVLRLRLRARDNHRDEHRVSGSQEALFPLQQWCELRIDPAAPPLEEQNIQAQHTWLEVAGHTARQQLVSIEEVLRQIQQETAQDMWQEHHRVLMRQVMEQLRDRQQLWGIVSQETAAMPELRPMVVAVHRVREAWEEAARQANRWNDFLTAPQRQEFLRHLRAALNDVEQQLTLMHLGNQRLAQARRQAWQLEQMARRLQQLANRLDELADVSHNSGQWSSEWNLWQREWQQWWENAHELRQAWEYTVRVELASLRQRGQSYWQTLLQLQAAEKIALQMSRQLLLQAHKECCQASRAQAETLLRLQQQLDLADVPLVNSQPWQETLIALQRENWLEALTAQEQAVRIAQRQAELVRPHDAGLSQRWQQLAEELHKQRTHLAAFQQNERQYLLPLASLPPHCLPRVQRCAEAAKQTLKQLAQSEACQAALHWLALELQQSADYWQQGNWLAALQAVQIAGCWLALAEATSASQPDAFASLEALRYEWQTICQMQRFYAQSPAVMLAQQRAGMRVWIEQVDSWLQEWKTLLQTTPPLLLPEKAVQEQTLGRCRAALHCWQTLIDSPRPDRTHSGVTRPTTDHNEYHALEQSLRAAIAQLPSWQKPADETSEDATIPTCLESLRRAQRLIVELQNHTTTDPQQRATLYRRIAQYLCEAGHRRLLFPPDSH